MKVIDRFKVGVGPQHIVPSWDLRTLWVTNNAEGRTDGSLTPIDPRTGKPGKAMTVDDPYNMYFTPDGKSAIVVAEARKRLDFRDPKTMALQYSIDVPGCPGVNHADFSIDGRFAIFTCEFSGTLVKIDLVERKVLGYLKLQMPATRFKEVAGAPRTKPGQVWEPGESEVCTVTHGMPQDIRASPDGKRYYIADMHADGVHVVDGDSFKQIGFIPTGLGAHGLYPSRDGRHLYVANRGSHKIHGPRLGNGGVTVIDFATDRVVARWAVPGGGSPDMGNVSADGKWLWLAARYDDVVYRFDTSTGEVRAGQGRRRAAWPDGVAAAGALFVGAHRQRATAMKEREPARRVLACGGVLPAPARDRAVAAAVVDRRGVVGARLLAVLGRCDGCGAGRAASLARRRRRRAVDRTVGWRRRARRAGAGDRGDAVVAGRGGAARCCWWAC